MQPEILIVDDDYSIRETLKIMLVDEGYAVVELTDGRAALDYLRQHENPMVVLLDHVMPGMDGARALREIACDSQLSRKHAYVLLTASARTDISSMLSPLDGLPVEVIPKPFDMDDLLARVARLADVLKQGERSASA